MASFEHKEFEGIGLGPRFAANDPSSLVMKQLSREPVLLAVLLLGCSSGALGTGGHPGGTGGSGASLGTGGTAAGGSVGAAGAGFGGVSGTAGASIPTGNGGSAGTGSPSGSGGSAGKGGGGGLGGMPGSGGAGAGYGTTTCQLNCADQSLMCNPNTGGCVVCLKDANCLYRAPYPTAICLPSGQCGCNADSQCAGLSMGTRCVASIKTCGCDSNADCSTAGFLTCAPNHRCGCSSNQDCVGQMDPELHVPVSVCNPSSGYCVGCVSDADCTDANARVCKTSTGYCAPCKTSTDCAQNADGPVCADLGQYAAGIGGCYCNTDTDCAGRAGGPHCVSDGSNFNKCGCATAADCTGDAQGHACVPPFVGGWLQCGCMTSTDCPSGKTCRSLGSVCQ